MLTWKLVLPNRIANTISWNHGDIEAKQVVDSDESISIIFSIIELSSTSQTVH